MSKIAEMKEMLESWLQTEFSKGAQCCDASECGQVTDMIKDFSETEKNCWETKYYKAVVEAMEDKSQERYYTPTPDTMYKPYIDQKPYMDAYLHDPNGFEDNMRMGYQPSTNYRNMSSKYGQSYDGWNVARRHYTDTKSMDDKERMDDMAKEYLHDTIRTIKEMWKEADPTLRKKMKSDLTELVGEMPV